MLCLRCKQNPYVFRAKVNAWQDSSSEGNLSTARLSLKSVQNIFEFRHFALSYYFDIRPLLDRIPPNYKRKSFCLLIINLGIKFRINQSIEIAFRLTAKLQLLNL